MEARVGGLDTLCEHGRVSEVLNVHAMEDEAIPVPLFIRAASVSASNIVASANRARWWYTQCRQRLASDNP